MGDEGSNFYIQLDEEMDKIIMIADSFNRRASTRRRTLSGRSKNSLKNPRRNVLLVRKTKQKKTQPSCKAELPLLLHNRPRLSPLAARAALAAAVTPLRQAQQAIVFQESQKFSVHSASCKVCTSCMAVGEDDLSNLHVLLEQEDQHTSMQAATIPASCFRNMHVCRCVCDLMEKSDVELIIDIPVYKDFLLEKAIDFTIDIPVSEI